MAEKSEQTAAVMSTAAAVMAGLAWLSKPAAAGQIPPELMNLVIAIASSSDNIDKDLDQVISELAGLSINTRGWVPNADGIRSTRVVISALDQPQQLPPLPVPDDMAVLLKGWPTNAGLVYVGGSNVACIDVQQAWPLLPNELVGYRVQNANQLYVAGITGAGSFVGDMLAITVEHRSGGV